MSTLMHYAIGYGVPAFIITITTSITLAGFELYLRKTNDGVIVSCFLSVDAMPAIIAPAILVAVVNCFVTIRAIIVAHKAGARRQDLITWLVKYQVQLYLLFQKQHQYKGANHINSKVRINTESISTNENAENVKSYQSQAKDTLGAIKTF